VCSSDLKRTSPITLEEAVKADLGLMAKQPFHDSAELPPPQLRAAAIFKEDSSERDDSPGIASDRPDDLVVTHLPLSTTPYGTDEERAAVEALESRIEDAVQRVGGDHDGNEFGDGRVQLFTFGPDADAVLEAVRSALGDFPVRAGAYAEKRYASSDEDDPPRRERVELS